jgi:protein-S-isoprenylcysteine O-methyltransferase Ste14
MDKNQLVAIYLSGLAIAELLRFPQRVNRFRGRQVWQKASDQSSIMELVVLTSVILGFWIFPLMYSFTPWLSAFNYVLPTWANRIAILLFFWSLIIRLIAQLTLSQSWSSTLETSENHKFIQSGVYSFTRHPIYVSLIFWALAQPFLLQNYLAGVAGPVAVMLIWFVRVPREEAMMIDIFGDEYLYYMKRTGRFLPLKHTFK